MTRILMFHRVLADRPTAFGLPSCYRLRGTALTPQEFARILDGLETVLDLTEVEDALASGSDVPRGAVLTFDDGYREHLEIVAQMLAARGLPAVFYVATGFRGRHVAVVDAWYWLLDHARTARVSLRLPDGTVFNGRVDTVDGKQEFVVGRPKVALLQAVVSSQWELVRALSAALSVSLPDDLAARLYLAAEEWPALASLGLRVGAHTVTHPRLTQVEGNVLDLEVVESVEALRTLGPVAFAYPDGAYDNRVKAAVKRAGVSSAVTCEEGVVTTGTDRLRLPRVFVQPN